MPSCACLAIVSQALCVTLWLAMLPGEPDTSPMAVAAANHSEKVVVITGGTGGLGRRIVELFAKRGDVVYTCGRNTQKVQELNEIPGVHAAVVDVGEPDAVAAWARDVLGKHAGIDVLVNNAGVLRVGDPAASITMANYAKVMDVNVRAAVSVTGAFWPHLRRPAGIVVNIGSTTETPKLAQAFHTLYSMSKCALRAFSTGLRQEGLLVGVHVVHVKAGAFESNLHDSFGQSGKTLSDEYAHTEFAKYGDALQKGILEKVKMVTEKSGRKFAEMLFMIAHPATGVPSPEYWLNVSWLELLAEWLPQALLDRTILQDYRAQARGSQADRNFASNEVEAEL